MKHNKKSNGRKVTAEECRGDVDKMLRKLRKMLEREGTFYEMKKHERKWTKQDLAVMKRRHNALVNKGRK